MSNAFVGLFARSDFAPHGMCFLWDPYLLWLHVISDILIFSAYYSIPLGLVYFARRRKDIEFRWLFVMFAAFILACGTTHLLDAWNVWNADYWLSGLAKAITAGVSVTTAVLVWLMMPLALTLPSPTQLRQANDNLNREVKERRQAMAALRETEERFRSAFDHAPIGMALVSPEGRWLRSNQALSEMLGYPERELQDLNFQSLSHPEDLQQDLALVRETLAGRRQSYQMEKRYRHRDGRIIWALLSVSLVRDEQDKPLYFVSQIQDITERRELQRELERRVKERTRELAWANEVLERTNRKLDRLARYDELTGLANRRHLMEQLEQAFAAARRYKMPLCLMMLDADHFKRINDDYGHSVGDQVLGRLGQLIRDNLRASDMAGRYGGEEFCIALPHTDLEAARTTAEKLRRQVMQEAIRINDGQTLHITVSIGLSVWRAELKDVGALLDEADEALYRAKEAGRNRLMLAAGGQC